MDTPGHEPDRSLQRRRARAMAMYNEVFVRLIVAAIVTFAVIFGAAYLYLAPLGARSIRAVVPVLDAFMAAASQHDDVGVRRLLSADLVRSGRLPAIEALMAQPTLFAGYEGLTVESFRMLPATDAPALIGGSAGRSDMAHVRATVRYTDGSRARLDAVLVLENEVWRVNDLTLLPLGERP